MSAAPGTRKESIVTDSTSDKGVPARAKPTVFHHEGRRLFLIDGEPRIVDVDMGAEAGLKRRREIRDTIAAQLSNIVSFGKVYRVDAADGTASVIETSESGDVCELRLPTAIRDQLYALLEAEGILGVSRPGVKPAVWLLSKDQMLWVVAKSRTAEADALLKELFRVYKAWEAGTLEPARPAFEPPKAPEALPPPADLAPPVAIAFRGIAYELVGEDLYVIDESLYRAGGYSPARMRAVYSDLPAVGPTPPSASLVGALLLSPRHVDFLSAALRIDPEERLSAGFAAVLQILRAHAHGRVEVVGGTLMERMGPDGASREYAVGRAGGPGVLGWAPAPFIRDGGRRLRVRHSQLALAFGIGDGMLLFALNEYRRDLPGEIFERHERQHGLDVIGVYLDEAQCVMLGTMMGYDGEAIAGRLFDERLDLEADLHARAMADLKDMEARQAELDGVRTLASSIGELKEAVSTLAAAAAGGLTPRPAWARSPTAFGISWRSTAACLRRCASWWPVLSLRLSRPAPIASSSVPAWRSGGGRRDSLLGR